MLYVRAFMERVFFRPLWTRLVDYFWLLIRSGQFLGRKTCTNEEMHLPNSMQWIVGVKTCVETIATAGEAKIGARQRALQIVERIGIQIFW